MTMRIFAALVVTALPAAADEATGLGTALILGGTPRAEFSALEPAQSGGGVTLVLPDPAIPGDLRILRTTLGEPVTGEAEAYGDIAAFALPVPADAPAIGFAILDPSPQIAVSGGALRVDVTGDGAPETLSVCLTIEAVQLRAVNDGGEEVWQGYVPLGYDVEPTCP